MSKKLLVAAIVSQPHPQKGQSHRSSGDFSYQDLPDGTTKLEWVIDQNSNDGWEDIAFDVAVDISGGNDSIVFSGVMSGNKTDVRGQGRKLYITNPAHASDNFTVMVYAIYN